MSTTLNASKLVDFFLIMLKTLQLSQTMSKSSTSIAMSHYHLLISTESLQFNPSLQPVTSQPSCSLPICQSSTSSMAMKSPTPVHSLMSASQLSQIRICSQPTIFTKKSINEETLEVKPCTISENRTGFQTPQPPPGSNERTLTAAVHEEKPSCSYQLAVSQSKDRSSFHPLTKNN